MNQEQLAALRKLAGKDTVGPGISRTTILQLLDYIETLEKDAAHKQARIDALMLEFCPEEMTKEQVVEWAKHQVPAKGETE